MVDKIKSRRERFETVGARRVQSILDHLDVLANCANKNNYEYTEADVRKMFNAIREKVKNTEAAFVKELDRTNRNTFKF